MHHLMGFGWVLVLILVAVQDSKCDLFVADKYILNLLNTGYRKEVRPRCPDEPAVDVIIDLALRQIIEVNEPKQILQTNVWLRLSWNDCRLAWNESESGVSMIVVPATFVWTPDVTLYDNADEGIIKVSRQYRVIVKSNGDCRHQIPVVLRSLCRIDTTHFPFDHQSCALTFGMWAYNGLEVNLTNLRDSGDIGSYTGHAEWTLDRLPASRTAPYFEGVPYPTVVYTLELTRKPLFFIINLFFPCVLISTVAILGFLLPPDAGEKVNLEVTVMLSLAVFQLIVLDMMPPSSETLPYISIYFASTMFLVGVSCFMTVVVLNVHFKGSQGCRVPDLVMWLFVDGLGRLLCVRRSSMPRRSQSTDEAVKGVLYQRKMSSKRVQNGVGNGQSGVILNRMGSSFDTTQDSLGFGEDGTRVSVESGTVLEYFRKINDSLSSIASKLSHRESEKDMCEDWHLVARVLDRTFIIVYGVASVIMLVVFLAKFTDNQL